MNDGRRQCKVSVFVRHSFVRSFVRCRSPLSSFIVRSLSLFVRSSFDYERQQTNDERRTDERRTSNDGNAKSVVFVRSLVRCVRSLLEVVAQQNCHTTQHNTTQHTTPDPNKRSIHTHTQSVSQSVSLPQSQSVSQSISHSLSQSLRRHSVTALPQSLTH